MIEEYEGIIAEIIFHNRENGYTVAVFETETEAFTCVGTIPGVDAGRSFRIQGEFVDNPRYGEQFRVDSFSEIMPSSAEGIREFLASGAMKGIGRKTAAAIVEKFGEDTFRIIEEEPERLKEISGIGAKTALKISEAFTAHREFAEITMSLSRYGISGNQAVRIYQVYGKDTIKAVKENPYALVDDVYGIGFRKADTIAAEIGIRPDDRYRIESGILYTLKWFAGEGNTYLPETELCEKAAQLLDLSREKVAEGLEFLVFDGRIRLDMIEGRRVVYPENYYIAEQRVCQCIRQLTDSPRKPVMGSVDRLIEATEEETGIRLSDNQKHAVKTSLDMGVSVITGGPGTGKTTIINTIINILEGSGLSTAIAAPTGRAAKRITETSGHEASTIHRLLEYSFFTSGEGAGIDEGFMRFGRDEENPLEYDAVIVDEASMIDLMLMDSLLRALTPGTRLIIVGDEDQLPSVGAGNVLRDIIASEYVYCTRLTEIFRQARESMIVVNAHRINRGEYPQCNARDKDFFLLNRHSEKEMLDTIKDLCLRRLPGYFSDLNPLEDIQVLSPVRKGTIGCINLNTELQQVLNPPSEEKNEKKHGDRIFREGDKVMQIRNNYELKWRNMEDFTDGEGVFNGDVGFIDSIDTEFNEVNVIFDGGRYTTYSYSQLDELEPAYAITVHKSQGSEFPVVVMPVSWFPPMLATRNLLYTAVTRGKKAVVLVGSQNKLNAIVDNDRISMRYSGLAERLAGLMNIEI
ncbi:MAG: ATP-dependent RecD-like DNA helicase [Lentihominibacter sp.]